MGAALWHKRCGTYQRVAASPAEAAGPPSGGGFPRAHRHLAADARCTRASETTALGSGWPQLTSGARGRARGVVRHSARPVRDAGQGDHVFTEGQCLPGGAMSKLARFAALVCVAAITGCGSGSKPLDADYAPAFAGNWNGTLVANLNGQAESFPTGLEVTAKGVNLIEFPGFCGDGSGPTARVTTP